MTDEIAKSLDAAITLAMQHNQMRRTDDTPVAVSVQLVPGLPIVGMKSARHCQENSVVIQAHFRGHCRDDQEFIDAGGGRIVVPLRELSREHHRLSEWIDMAVHEVDDYLAGVTSRTLKRQLITPAPLSVAGAGELAERLKTAGRCGACGGTGKCNC